MIKTLLLRYDTEHIQASEIEGFLLKAIAVHRKYQIPVTFFCTGQALENRKKEFIKAYNQTKDNPLFDFQDHSYSHIGIGYKDGKNIDTLKTDYEKSFKIHRDILHKSPQGVAICGTSGVDGPRLKGFDENKKGISEIEMLSSLGVKMINSFLSDYDETSDFISYETIGYPKIMGYPSAESDTSWFWKKNYTDAISYIKNKLQQKADANKNYAIIFHDWVTWLKAPDQDFTHVIKIADMAREMGFTIKRHIDCYDEVMSDKL